VKKPQMDADERGFSCRRWTPMINDDKNSNPSLFVRRESAHIGGNGFGLYLRSSACICGYKF